MKHFFLKTSLKRMEQCFQFAPGVPEPLGSGGYHAEMKNGFSLTLDSLKLNWNCC